LKTGLSCRLIGTAILALSALAWVTPAQAQKFYPDDPLWKEPPPEDTIDPQMVVLSSLLEFFTNQFTRPGERQPATGVIPAQNTNTLGEVPDSPWYTNRHGRNRMSIDELVAGPGNNDPPRMDEPWRVLTVKPFGDRTGILLTDAEGTIYLLRFDPKDYLELQTGAELVSSKFYYAAGYNVLENYLVYFDREQLVINEGAEEITSFGELRDLLPEDIDKFLKRVARDRERGYRAVATRAPYTTILGNYQFYATRSDDPNDVVPHEHRRDLRGQWVLHAWLSNHEFNPANTLEALASDGRVQYVRRYIIHFFKTLGAGEKGRKEARDGNEYRFDIGTALRNVGGMGFVTPSWAWASHPRVRSIGRFEGDKFDADNWTADTHYVTWANRLPDDLYWGAKLVMSFTDEQIRAIVDTGGYSDPRATQWISDALKKRRDKIGRAFFSKVLPLDNFRVVSNRLEFDDLMVEYGFAGPRELDLNWLAFNNDTEVGTFVSVDPEDERALPPDTLSADAGEYFAAQIDSVDAPGMNVIAYLRKQESGFKVVGIDRNWPGKLVVEPEAEVGATVAISLYSSLDDRRQGILDGSARAYNETTGRNLTTAQWFDQLTLSERTTFDAVTHALMNSELTDENGEDLGTAFDLIEGLERIAGQYSGRGGDQQFRLYVNLRPDGEDILERSTQFLFGHENTVYHVGYPRSYRQEGDVPNMQFSVSEDGRRGDIDVDYRSSKSPQALFNGHLTSANSDVRAGDNYDKHNGRWAGLVNWWQDFFGGIGVGKAAGRDLLAHTNDELPTPLPPDRPFGAAPEELYEASQEFLTDWLVRGKVDEAMWFFSRRVIACINIDEGSQTELLDVDSAVVAMREIMTQALEELPDRDNLTEALDEVAPQNEDQADRIVSHPFERDFTILQVRNQVAADYMCSTRRTGEPPSMPGGPDALGTYYGVIFRFKARDDLGGAIGLLWDRQEGTWQIVSYDIIQF
jgi:hypothetical protein